MTRTAAVLSAFAFASSAAAAAPVDWSQPMTGDTVRVPFSSDCGPCQADLAAAQSLYESGVPVVIEATDGLEGFDSARALRHRAAPSVSMVTGINAQMSRSLMDESRAMTGFPPTLAELTASLAGPPVKAMPRLEERMQAYDSALNALWQTD